MGKYLTWQTSALVLLLILAFVLLIVLLRSPSHARNWNPLQQHLPHISFDDEQFSVLDVRDFRYAETGEVAINSYVQKSYRFADLEGIWFGLSHFGGMGMAHAFLSFEFANGEYLSLSIEARLPQGQGYSPFKGLLRRYEKIYVFGTEADIVGLRSHVRGEAVYLYPIALNQQDRVDVLRHYLMEARQLEQTPDFYNTLLDNCLTGILRAKQHFSNWDFLTDSRLIFPGRSDLLAYEMGLIKSDLSLEKIRARARVDAGASDPMRQDFSSRIRKSWSEGEP